MELPNSWVKAKLGEIAEILDSKRIPINSTERNARISNKKISELYPYYGATGEVGKIDDFLFEGQNLLIGEDGAPFLEPFKNKAYLVSGKFWVNNHAHILQFGESNKFFCHYLNQFNFAQYVTGTTRLKLNQASLKEIPLLLPPLPEQHRIVAKIEALFSELDKGIESLKTAQQQLKIYRQALLKQAFSGKLTEQWRAENQDKLETAEALLQRIQMEREQRYQAQLKEWETNGKQGTKPKAPKVLPPLTDDELAELPELPAGWAWACLGNTNADISDGPFGSNLKSSDYVDSGARVIRLENIGVMQFIENKKTYITEEKFNLLKNHATTSGDIIFSSFIVENTRVVILPSTIQKAVNKADCFRIRVFGESLDKHFLVMFLSTQNAYKQLESFIHGVGRPRINTTQLKEMLVPICSSVEQFVIIEKIESRLSITDQLEQTITIALQQAEVLRQSILKKAFSGQLVPQDPNDEPASVLLERIKAEKAKSKK